MKRFAFYGRASTEDHHDPAGSRSWQLSLAQTLIAPSGGTIVDEFFDNGASRLQPWPRRPESARLIAALKDPDRGFDAVVIGEPQRAFYGNQFGLTFPLFTHTQVELWVPELGGPVDPANDAHNVVMALYGGMSQGERNRIRLRVRAAMAAHTAVDGRFLGGRPPYGYRLIDVGPHPDPAKAAQGQRSRRLDPDPQTAGIVRRIFAQYLNGQQPAAIARQLNHEGVPCRPPTATAPPSAGGGWTSQQVRRILGNPRYTGRMVWNQTRRDEVLVDVEDVALGHRTVRRANPTGSWVWSKTVSHPAVIDIATYTAAGAQLASRARHQRTDRRASTTGPGLFAGMLFCSTCEQPLRGTRRHRRVRYRCQSCPTGNDVSASGPPPATVDDSIVRDLLDDWLADQLDAQHNTLREAIAGSGKRATTVDPASELAHWDRVLDRYRAALEAGADPALIAEWTRDACTERDAVRARQRAGQLAPGDTAALLGVREMGGWRSLLHSACDADRVQLYRALRIRLKYDARAATLLVGTALSPEEQRTEPAQLLHDGELRREQPSTR